MTTAQLELVSFDGGRPRFGREGLEAATAVS